MVSGIWATHAVASVLLRKSLPNTGLLYFLSPALKLVFHQGPYFLLLDASQPASQHWWLLCCCESQGLGRTWPGLQLSDTRSREGKVLTAHVLALDLCLGWASVVADTYSRPAN